MLWPVLRAGFVTDDFIVAAMIDGTFAAPRAPLDLFVFTTGEPADIAALQRLGSMPFWVDPDFRLAFMRPLASATVHLDRWLFGRDLAGYHAHSLVWWVILVCSVAWFLRTFLPRGLALAATVLFAVSDAHHYPVLWLANRGGIMSLALGVLALCLCISPRARPRWHRTALPTLFYSASLLAGEWGFSLLGYGVAHVLLSGRGDWHKRLLTLWPLLVPAASVLGARAMLGYGAHASGVYVDPLGEPLGFVRSLATRLPILVADMVLDIPAHYWDVGSPWRDTILRLGWIPPDIWIDLPGWRTWHVVLGYAAVAGALLAVHFGLRLTEARWRPALRFLALGAALSMLPVAASFPSSRLSLPAWLGGSACFAALLLGVTRRIAQLKTGNRKLLLLATGVAGALVYNLVWSPLTAPVLSSVIHFESASAWVRLADVDDERLPDQHVFIVNGTDFASTFFFPYVRSYSGLQMPRSSYPLAFCRHPLDLLRDGDNSFLLRPVGNGTFMETDGEIFFRRTDRMPKRGTRFVLPEMTVEVVRTRNGRPLELRYTFTQSLDDPSYVFLVSKPAGMVPLEIPPVGDWIRLARPATPTWYGAHRGAWYRRIAPVPDFLTYRMAPDFLDYEIDGPARSAPGPP